jgi:integrase
VPDDYPVLAGPADLKYDARFAFAGVVVRGDPGVVETEGQPMKRHANKGLRKLCDCPRRIWAKCPHSWYLNFKPRGGPSYRLSLDKELDRHIDSRTEADTEAARIRGAIRAGAFHADVPALERLTLGALLDLYRDRYLAVHRPGRAGADKRQVQVISATPVPVPAGEDRPFSTWFMADITADTLERFREVRLARGGGRIAVNRNLSLLRAVFNWAVRVGYLHQTAFKRSTETIVRLTVELPRSRRLEDDEERKLLAACGRHLHDLVLAAVETGCRRGELLSLRWNQVRGDPIREITLPACKTKTKKDRTIPVSTRLRAVLEMRRNDPAGEPLPGEACVFGNELGQPVDLARATWPTAVLRSHGITLEWTATGNLSPACRDAYRAIGLHFHDLRREAGSRWLEGGVPIMVIRDWLGHSNVTQTSTYLASTSKTAADAMGRFEEYQIRLQRIATGGSTGGRKRPSTAVPTDRKTRKTADGRGTAVVVN